VLEQNRAKDLTHCGRCGEKLKYDKCEAPSEEMAEISDKNGEWLIMHVTCILKDDTIA
jgi:hypothetical protein